MTVRNPVKRITFGLLSTLFLLALLFYMTPRAIRLLYPKEVANISPSAAWQIAQLPNTLVLDVREEAEYEVSHLAGAQRYTPELLNNVNPETQILVYCTVGVRSARLAQELKGRGFTDVQNIDLGILSWKNNGLAVVDMNGQPTEKVHVYKGFFGLWLKKGKAVY